MSQVETFLNKLDALNHNQSWAICSLLQSFTFDSTRTKELCLFISLEYCFSRGIYRSTSELLYVIFNNRAELGCLKGYAISVRNYIYRNIGDGYCLYNIGFTFERNFIDTRNQTDSFLAFHKAYEILPDCHLKYDTCAIFADKLMRGTGVDRREHAGYLLLKHAAENKSDRAEANITHALIHGIARAKDPDEELCRYKKLAKSKPDYVHAFLIRLLISGQTIRYIKLLLDQEFIDKISEGHSKYILNLIYNEKFQRFLAKNEYAIYLMKTYVNYEKPEFKKPSFKSSEEIRYITLLAGFLYELAQIEDYVHKSEWLHVLIRLSCFYYGLSYRMLLANTQEVGPLFVEKTKLGFPKPRQLPSPQGLLCVRESLENDLISFYRTDNTVFYFTFDFSNHFDAYGDGLLTRKDILLAFAAAFDKSAYQGLSFSLEGYSENPEDSFVNRFSSIEKCIIDPWWLMYTDIGKSIYWADRTMPTFGVDSIFSVKDAFAAVESDDGLQESIPSFYREVEACYGASPFTWSRQSIDLDWVELIRARRNYIGSLRRETFRFKDMRMRFDASYISYDDDGREKSRSEYPNDPSTQVGQKAQLGSERFDEIAYFFPVYARIRLFMAIMHLVGELRDSGIQLGWPLESQVRRIRERCINRGRKIRAVRGEDSPTVIRPFKGGLRFPKDGF